MDGKRSLEISKNMGDFENNVDDEMDLRRGPWTVEEDFKLSNYISTLGEGRWNSLARCAGMIQYHLLLHVETHRLTYIH